MAIYDNNQLRRIGILGGTFNPIHNGHINVAVEVRQKLALSEVRLIPCADPPHRDKPEVDSNTRFELVCAAVDAIPGLVADDREIRRGGTSYSFDTLTQLRIELPHASFFMLVGSDAFAKFDTWKRWRQILKLCHIVVVQRPGWSREKFCQSLSEGLSGIFKRHSISAMNEIGDELCGAILTLEVTPWDISSTQIRQAIARQESIDEYVPPLVAQKIYKLGLYQKQAAVVQ